MNVGFTPVALCFVLAPESELSLFFLWQLILWCQFPCFPFSTQALYSRKVFTLHPPSGDKLATGSGDAGRVKNWAIVPRRTVPQKFSILLLILFLDVEPGENYDDT